MTTPLILRRFGMIDSFLESAKVLLHPILKSIDGYRSLDTDTSGVPFAPHHVIQLLIRMSELNRAKHFASCCVATTNLGYAYEHVFKLLIFLEKGRNSKGHDLALLYDKICSDTQGELSRIYRSVQLHDFEIEDVWGNPPPREESRPDGPIELRQLLKYWTDECLLQGSRYKYSDEKGSPAQIRIFVPLRSVHVIDQILWQYLGPRLNISRVRVPSR